MANVVVLRGTLEKREASGAWVDHTVEVTSEGTVHGFGTVALRALARGRQLWDASAPYSAAVPAEAPSDRYLALEVSRSRVGYFRLGPLDGDRADV